MTWIFFVCALVGGTILVAQFVMTLIGLGIETADLDLPDDVPDDVPDDIPDDLPDDAPQGASPDHDHHDSTHVFKLLSVKSVIAALAFFGLGGLAATEAQLSQPVALVIAVVAGVAAMYVIAWIMGSLTRLDADATVRISSATGEIGTVYIPIPPKGEGSGKVQVRAQGQLREYAAVSNSPEKLPTGAKVVVIGAVDSSTLEVEAVDEPAIAAEES